MNPMTSDVRFCYAPADGANVPRFKIFLDEYARTAHADGLRLRYETQPGPVVYVSATGQPERVTLFQEATQEKMAELL